MNRLTMKKFLCANTIKCMIQRRRQRRPEIAVSRSLELDSFLESDWEKNAPKTFLSRQFTYKIISLPGMKPFSLTFSFIR